jgi:HlyD family secretion protein
VRLLEPDPRLRPDFLCRAEFLPPLNGHLANREDRPENAPTAPDTASGRSLRLFIPLAALPGGNRPETAVFVLDISGERLEERRIRLGRTEREGFIQVLSGLLPGERVVLRPSENLRHGQRVRPTHL